MSKSRTTGTNSSKVGRNAASGRFVSAESAKVSPKSATVIKSTSKRYSTALKNLAKR